jgi:ankyrin repeat protein
MIKLIITLIFTTCLLADYKEDINKYINNNNLKGIEKLIKDGLDVNEFYVYDENILMTALQKEDIDINIIKAIVNAGANVHALNSYGEYLPLNLAARNNRLDLVKYLIQSGASVQSQNHGMIGILQSTKNIEILEYLLKNKYFDINYQHEYYQESILVHGLKFHNKSLELVKFLVKKGIDVNLQDNEGYTALMLAVKNNLADIVKYLLDNGAKIDIKDFDGKTVLDYIKESTNKDIKKAFHF